VHKHRVTLYSENIYVWDALSLYDTYSNMPTPRANLPVDDLTVIEYFSHTREAAWAEQQADIQLILVKDEVKHAYTCEVSICADLTDRQYADYILRGLRIE